MKKAVILFFEGYISVAPTIINLSEYLTRNGYSVKIISSKNEKFRAYDPKIKGVSIKRDSFNLNLFHKIVLWFLAWVKYHNLSAIYRDYLAFISYEKFVIRELKSRKADLCIAVDTIGLAAITSLSSIKKLVYLSLEIDFLGPSNLFLGKESNLLKKRIKAREKSALKRLALVVIQDKERLKLLCKENCWTLASVPYFLLPNSPNSLNENEKINHRYFRNLFGISEDSFLVLAAGMICDETMSYEIVVDFVSSPKDYVLVLHERVNKTIKYNRYLASIEYIKNPSIYLSLNPLLFEDIYKIYQDCDIGLVLYNPKYGNNFSNIVFASGKLSHYLKFGKPVIVNDINGMRSLIESYKCGAVITEVGMIDEKIREIRLDYENYSKGARKCFEDIFCFDKNVETLLSRIN